MPAVDRCGVVWLRADGYDLVRSRPASAEFVLFQMVLRVGRFADEKFARDERAGRRLAARTTGQEGGCSMTELAPLQPGRSWVALRSPAMELAQYVADTTFVPTGLRGNAPAIAAASCTATSSASGRCRRSPRSR